MFGRINGNQHNDTIWANYNGKKGLFTIDHKEQNSEQSYRKHVTAGGRTVFKEEFPDLISAFVRRVMVREEPSYDDKNKMEKKIAISFRSPEGKDAVVKFSMGSSALQVLGALNAADLTKPVTLKSFFFAAGEKAKDKDGNEVIREKDEVRLVGYQGDEKLVNKYNDDPDVKVPKAEVIEVRNPTTQAVIQTVKDFTLQQNFTVDLANALAEKVKAASSSQPAPAPASAAAAPAAAAAREEAVGATEDPSLNAADILGDEGAADAEAFSQQPG